MKIAILEDESHHAKHLHNLLEAHYGEKLRIRTFSGGSTMLEYYAKGVADFDLLFLDIIGVDGIAAAHAVRETNPNVLIVFVTSANATAREIYETDAIGYIEKPISAEALTAVLAKAERLTAAKVLPVLSVKSESGATYRLSLSDVTYITKDERSTVFHRLREAPIVSPQPISVFCGIIEAQSSFVSIFRSDYVNLMHVHKIHKSSRTIELSNGQTISMARDRISDAMNAFTKFLGEP